MKTLITVAAFHSAVEVEVMVLIDSTVKMEVNTRARLKLLHKRMSDPKRTYSLNLNSKSAVLFNLQVQQNRHLIPSNFVYKYFSKNDTPVTKLLNGKYDQHSLCYFTGHVGGESETIVSLNLCNKVKGVIDYPSRTYSIKTVLSNSQPKYYLSIQRNLDSNKSSISIPYLIKWPSQQKLARTAQITPNNQASLLSFQRIARELKPTDDLGLEVYFVEIYVVLDYSVYEAKDHSVDKSIELGFKILNYAAALYIPLNIYLTVVGMEVWNNGNRINYDRLTRDGTRFINNDPTLRTLAAYRVNQISPNISSNNIQLVTTEKLNGGLIGFGSTAGMCTSDSAGLNLYRPGDFSNTADTLAHELAHAFWIPHVNSKFRGNTACKCSYNGTLSFYNCIMSGSSSK